MADQLKLEVNKPAVAESEEPTRSAPAKGRHDEQSKQDQEDIKLLLDAVQTEIDSWATDFRAIVARTLEAYEFLKGNHFFDFWAGTTDMFNAFQGFQDYLSGDGGTKEDEDLSLSDLPTNLYQMLFFGYQAMLSADLPRNVVSPVNADEGEDRETAKGGTTAMTIIAQKNNARKLHLKKLFQFWCSGHFWEYTRYVVDAERFKTHKETVLKVSKQQIVPDRFVCMNCGTATPLQAVAGQDQPVCPKCGRPLGQDSVYPGYADEIPVAEEQADIPNGMVCKNIFGPLHVTFKPKATSRDETPVLRLQMEVSLGWLRDVFPDYYDDLKDGMGADGSEDQQQRQARQVGTSVVAQGGMAQTTLQQDPTYTRDWVQPWHFNKINDQNAAKRLKKKYPRGCMIAHVGRDMVLSVQPASIAEEWTTAATCEDVGLAGIPVGFPAIPIQKRFNNLTYMVDDFFERMAAGLVIVNSEYIDTKALNKKGLLPGVFNPVALRKNAPAQQTLANLVHQFVFEIEPQLLEYLASLPGQMQAVTGVMPQILGDDPGGNVQTFGGQKLQSDTAKGKLTLYWNQIRGQDAEAAEQGVSCAARNMTDKWWTTVTDKTKQFRNEYVHPDQMKGSVHVEPEEDQGLPYTAEQIQAFWEKILNNTNKAIAEMLFSEPKNVDACVRSFAIKGVIAPGSLAEARVLHLIDLLMKGEPDQEETPVKDASGNPAINPDGSPVMQTVDVPSVQPNMWLDDIRSLIEIVPKWATEHYDKWEGNDAGRRNLEAFVKLGLEMDYQKQQMMQKATAPPPGALPPPGQGQPKQLTAGPNQ
jgi:hypothetical protein